MILENTNQFNQTQPSIDFNRIRMGAKVLEDAIYELGTYKQINPSFGDKNFVLRAIDQFDYKTMRQISDFFYKTSGIYSRLCRYMAYLYRYDWLLTPYINGKADTKKVVDGFYKTLNFLDNFEVKRFLGEVALKVIRNGCYYGYVVFNGDSNASIQELPADYCRSRFSSRGRPLVEFNMRFFFDKFSEKAQRDKILEIFPPEFKKGCDLYEKNKLPPQFTGDTKGWYLLDAASAIKFNINGEDFPMFISAIPAIIDLDSAQELDKKKMQQQLLKIIIQKIPLDKNNDLVFDTDETRALHNNAVGMIGRAIGVDILTTPAEVTVADMADKNTTTATDELEKVERTVYNEAGVSQMQFNTDGNIALEKSILNDEASLYNLLSQFESFLNMLIEPFNKNIKKFSYRIQLLATTIYNYKEMAKLFKEHTTMGYSKMLPQIALGQSQSSILANAYFENDILDLANVFIPPMLSSTMNAEALQNRTKNSGEAGRKEKPDDEKSEKTIQNKESMN